MDKEDRIVQPAKALSPIDITLLGIVTKVNPVQPENAELPILVTLLPMVNEVRDEHDAKALDSIFLTSSPITTSFIVFQPENQLPISTQCKVILFI